MWKYGSMNSDYEKWDRIYRKFSLEALPWELGRPREVLVDLVEKGLIPKGKALDICCGAGNQFYGAGFPKAPIQG